MDEERRPKSGRGPKDGAVNKLTAGRRRNGGRLKRRDAREFRVRSSESLRSDQNDTEFSRGSTEELHIKGGRISEFAES